MLHRPAKPVTDFGPELAALVDDMFETNALAPGVGLAAPQIGVGLRLFIWDYEDQDEGPAQGVAINPTLWIAPLEPGSPGEDEVEGCLSFPGERFALRRSSEVLLQATGLDGKPFELRATGWFARIMQHEYDHLEGTLYVDRLVPPENRGAAKARKRRRWGVPGLQWTPGIDHLEGEIDPV